MSDPQALHAGPMIEMYVMHDHGPGTERHGHSTEMHHSGDVNNPRADDHADVATLPWDEWTETVRCRVVGCPCRPAKVISSVLGVTTDD
jgi:hypothetical protein